MYLLELVQQNKIFYFFNENEIVIFVLIWHKLCFLLKQSLFKWQKDHKIQLKATA